MSLLKSKFDTIVEILELDQQQVGAILRVDSWPVADISPQLTVRMRQFTDVAHSICFLLGGWEEARIWLRHANSVLATAPLDLIMSELHALSYIRGALLEEVFEAASVRRALA